MGTPSAWLKIKGVARGTEAVPVPKPRWFLTMDPLQLVMPTSNILLDFFVTFAVEVV